MANIDTIAEQRWVWAVEGQQIETINNERLITRKIDKINQTDLPELVEILRQRTSVKNPDDGDRHYSVIDPMVNGKVQEGTWRNVKVSFTEGVHNPGQTVNPAGVLIQILAYGWAQTLIDTEARLVGGDNQALQPERIIQRQYVALDFAKMGDMIEAIESTKYVTSPVIEGKTYDGPDAAALRWRILNNKQSRAADGSGIITQTLAKNLVMTPDDLPTPILLSDDKALLSPFAHDTTSVKNAYVWEYRWIDPDYAQTLRDTIALTAGIIDAKAVKAEDGSFNIQVLTQTNTWAGTLSQKWEHENKYPTFAANQIIDTFSHIPLASMEAHKTTLGTADTNYKVTSLVDSTAEEGYGKIVRVQDKTFVGAVTTENGIKTEEEAFFLLTSGVIRTTLWLGVKDADLTAAMATLLDAPTGYAVLRVGNTYNGTGSCNIVRTMVVRGGFTDRMQIAIEYPNFESEKITYHYPGLNKTDAESLYNLLLGYSITGAIVTIPARTIEGIAVAEAKIEVENNGYIYIRRKIADDTMLVATDASVPSNDATYKYYSLGQFLVVDDVAVSTLAVSGYKTDSVAVVESRYALAVVQVISKVMATPTEDLGPEEYVKRCEALGHTTEKEFEWWGDGETITKKWLNIRDADLEGMLTTLATAPTGYSVATIGHNFNGTGAADVVRVVTKQNTTGLLSAIEFPAFEGERKTYIYMGLDKTAADTKYTACLTAPAGYKVDSVTKQKGTRGTIDVIQQISKIQTGDTSAVRQQVYTHTFGLVTHATTVCLNVEKASIETVKAAINAIADIIVLEMVDNDNGRGAADITYTWRSKPAAAVALGAIQQTGPSQFHQATQDRVWIDVNLTDANALATAVAQAIAGTGDYAVATGDTIQSANGEDAGDKTGIIKQRIAKKPTAYTAADYSQQESLNPHGLKEAVMVISVKEYPEVAYANVADIFVILQAFLGTPAKGRIQVSMNQNETFSMRALKEGTPDWDNTAPAYTQVGVQNAGLIGETKNQLATGVPVANAAAIVAAATADTDYALVDASMTERGNGEATVEKKQVKKFETAVQVSETPAAGERRAVKDYTWPLVLSANVATVWAAAATQGVSGSYVLHFRQLNILGNGMFSIQSQVVECVKTTLADYIAGYTDDTVTTIVKVRDAATLPDAKDTAGTTETVQGGLNLYNKYDYVKTTVTAVKRQWSGSYEDRWGTVYYWEGRNCTATEVAAAKTTAALTSTTNNYVETSPTNFKDLFNYTIRKQPYNIDWKWFASPIHEEKGTGLVIKEVEWTGKGTAYRLVTTTYNLIYSETEKAAHEEMNGGGHGSKVWSDGLQWKTIKVTSIIYSAWTNATSYTWSAT